MRCSLIKAAELTPDLIAIWCGYQDANPLLRNPALRPELFRIVGRHYSRAWIAIFEDDRGIAGFLPLTRHPNFGFHAASVPICDYQDAILRPGCDVPLSDLLANSGIATFVFEHSLRPPERPPQMAAPEQYTNRIHVPVYDDYVLGLKENGKSLKNTMAKLRLLARDHGDVVFSEDSRDQKALDTLFEWRARRFHSGEQKNTWILQALHEIFATRTLRFSGVLSTLHAGDQLVAAHFGIKSGPVLYYWFPAFNPLFSKYTPGWLLIKSLLRTLNQLECDTVDLGPGGEPYKGYFSNMRIPVYGGCVEVPGALHRARRTYRAMREGLLESRTLQTTRRALQLISFRR